MLIQTSESIAQLPLTNLKSHTSEKPEPTMAINPALNNVITANSVYTTANSVYTTANSAINTVKSAITISPTINVDDGTKTTNSSDRSDSSLNNRAMARIISLVITIPVICLLGIIILAITIAIIRYRKRNFWELETSVPTTTQVDTLPMQTNEAYGMIMTPSISATAQVDALSMQTNEAYGKIMSSPISDQISMNAEYHTYETDGSAIGSGTQVRIP